MVHVDRLNECEVIWCITFMSFQDFLPELIQHADHRGMVVSVPVTGVMPDLATTANIFSNQSP